MSILEGVNELQINLLQVKRRLYVLQAFVKDLVAMTKGKE